jgi:hypothetical protein
MDEATTKKHIEAHADAVVRGDLEAVVADFTENMRSEVPAMAQSLLPQPTKSADVQSIEVGEEEAVSTIRYSGEDKTVTIRARWQDEGGRPQIVSAEPVD